MQYSKNFYYKDIVFEYWKDLVGILWEFIKENRKILDIWIWEYKVV